MKKILLLCLALVSFSFMSCLTTSNTFGEASASSSKDVKVFTDKFTGAKTYEYTKGLRGGFALSRGGLTTDFLEIYPHLIINEENICSAFLEMTYKGSTGALLTTGANKTYKKFMFLNDKGDRLEISPIVNPNAERAIGAFSTYSSPIVDVSGTYSMQITKTQFDVLKDFFSVSGSVQCAAYSTDNKVVTFSSYNNKWHQGIFVALDECVKNESPNVIYNEVVTQAYIK